jgi:general secretion pathway protein D
VIRGQWFGAALAVLLTACTAQPIRNVSELTNRLPSGQRNDTAAATTTAAPAATSIQAARRAAPPVATPRIDEVYPARDSSRAGGVAPVRPQAGDITLSFDGADLREVARAILGDILGLNYVIDTNVTGVVSLTTRRPLRRDDLLPTLEAVLASQGVRLLDYGNVVRLTRSADAEARAAGGIGFGPGTGYRVFTLDYVSAAEMRAVLQPLLPDGAVVAADARHNFVVVAGSAAVLRLAAGTIDIFDVDQLAGSTTALISLENADARTVAGELENIFSVTGAGGARGAGPLRLIPIERLNGILMIAPAADLADQAREWIYRLDRKRDPSERRVFVYYVQHGGAERLADALKGILGAGGGDNAARPEAGSAAATLTADDLKIAVDAKHNALLVSATPAHFALIDDVLARLDIQPLQVMIEASIFEVTLTDSLRYGVQYAISNGGLGVGEAGLISLTRGTTTQTGPGSIVNPVIRPIQPGFNFTLSGATATRFIIDALSDLTEVNMISSPNVIVLNNATARLNVGDVVPIITQQTTSAVTDNPLIVNTVQYRPTGVNLEVTPQVNASGMVTLQLAQEVSDVRVTTSSNINSPTIQNRSLLSTVSVRSGDTVMLGGLIREEASDGKSGIPLLQELPLIGSLFGVTSRSSRRTELVALIRPVVVATPEDSTNVTNSLRNKFLSLVRQEQEGIRQPRRVVVGQ